MAVTEISAEQLLGDVQELQARLDEHEGPARDIAEALVAAVVSLYGAGLERIADALGPDMRRVAEDPLISTLLLIHDLHPVPLSERVGEALDSVRPYMESHGGGVELVSLADGVATISLRGSCSDCAASSATLELAVKQALEELAPDLEGLEVRDMAPQMPGLSLPMADAGAGAGELPIVMSGPAAAPRWVELDSPSPPKGALGTVEVAGQPLLMANVDGTLLAYRDVCAGCGSPLHEGALNEGALTCPTCSRSFFLPAAGRSMDAERAQLEPVPLLHDGDRVKVALPGAG